MRGLNGEVLRLQKKLEGEAEFWVPSATTGTKSAFCPVCHVVTRRAGTGWVEIPCEAHRVPNEGPNQAA